MTYDQTAEAPDPVEIRLARSFRAPKDRVFDAWTNPEVLRTWWAAVPTWTGGIAEVDLRPDGAYRLSMQNPDGVEEHVVSGRYLEVKRPDRLVYTWAWEGDAEVVGGNRATMVEVDFHEEAGVTTVQVVHRGFPDEQVRDMHRDGWNGCLDNLARRVLTEVTPR